MTINKDTIKSSVTKAVNKYSSTIPDEELIKIISTSLYDILSSREFERYIKELAKK